MNLWAILVCTLMNMVLGALWYSILFGKPWMALMKISPDHMKDPRNRKLAQIGYATSAVCYLIMATVLAALISMTGAKGALGGAILGAVCALGFSMTSMIPNHLFGSAPLKLILINIGYPLVGLTLMGTVLGAWQ